VLKQLHFSDWVQAGPAGSVRFCYFYHPGHHHRVQPCQNHRLWKILQYSHIGQHWFRWLTHCRYQNYGKISPSCSTQERIARKRKINKERSCYFSAKSVRDRRSEEKISYQTIFCCKAGRRQDKDKAQEQILIENKGNKWIIWLIIGTSSQAVSKHAAWRRFRPASSSPASYQNQTLGQNKRDKHRAALKSVGSAYWAKV